MKREVKFQGIGDRLKQLREHLKYSREEMSSHFSLTKSGYDRNERGETFPSGNMLIRLAKNFGVSMDWLLFDRGPMYYKEKEQEAETPEEQKARETLQALQDAIPEVKELLDYMGRDPLLRYEVLIHFYKYKKEQEKKQ
jgi:transcriptional regulator with XRE-family HTH domain